MKSQLTYEVLHSLVMRLQADKSIRVDLSDLRSRLENAAPTPFPIHRIPGPLAQIRPGETRIYFAVPTCYTIGDTFDSYKEASAVARAGIKTFDYGGCSRAFVDMRIADETGDRVLHRVEVFAGPAEQGGG